MDLRGKQVAVVGMAKSGVAAIELLLGEGAQVRAIDTRPLEELGPSADRLRELNVPLLAQAQKSIEGVDLVVLSPGVPADLPEWNLARSRGVHVTGEVELAGWRLRGPSIGVTGANGKTTTTALIGHILRESGIACQVGGNIGTPPTAMVASSRDNQWNVLELSSFQLELIETFSAKIALGLNVTPDHLDRHGTLEKYAAAKRRLFETQQRASYAVLNGDDPTTTSWADVTAAEAHWFSSTGPVRRGAWLDGDRLLLYGASLMPASELPIRGRHNVENVLAAAIAARLAGATVEQIAAAVRSFPGVEHRLEFVRDVDGVRYYNDSKATNVDATLKALDAFPGGLWVILGGKDKGSNYTPLRAPLGEKARAALLIGAAAAKIGAQISGAVRVEQCGALESAIRFGWQHAKPGDTVLLAPACASFDQFENFEHRGRTFKELVAALPSREGK